MIQPALSAEEWDTLSLHDGPTAVLFWGDRLIIGKSDYCSIGGEEYPTGAEYDFSAPDLLRLAALCLYGRISWDMVDAVRSFAFYASGGEFCPVCRSVDVGWKMIEPPVCSKCGFRPLRKGQYRTRALDAADLLESLLPPRETP